MSDQWRLGRYRGEWIGITGYGDNRHRLKLYTATGKDCATRDEANAALKRRNEETAKALLPAVRSLDEIYAAYEKDRKDAGVVNITRIKEVGRTLHKIWGHLSPEDITKEEAKRYERIRKQQGCSDATIRQEIAYIEAAIRSSGRVIVGIEKPPVPRARERWLERFELAKLIDGAVAFHVKLFIVLAVTTAARPSHLLQLAWNRVDLDRRIIRLDDPERDRTRKGRATVPINDTALGHLKIAREAAQSEFVIEKDGHPIRSIRNGVKAAAKRAGLVGVSQYVLRHTAGVYMAQAGTPMAEIAQYMGHSSVNTTFKHYARFSPEYLRGAATALEIL